VNAERVELGDTFSGRRGPFVVLDLETGGLDPAVDDILQVAALVVDGPTGTLWSTLVRPTRAVAPEVLRLTGLDPDQLAGAPEAGAVLDELSRIVGTRGVVGHNLAFDLAFLRRHGLVLAPRLDTLTWARIAFPRLSSHRLEDLAPLVGDVGRFHDARTDVIAAYRLLGAIRNRLTRLAEPERAWLALWLPAEWQFFDIGAVAPDAEPGPLWRPAPDPPSRLEPGPASPVPEGSPAAWFDEAGLMGAVVPGFEARPGQAAMAEAVFRAFRDRRTLLVEAATGIGKSLAYLVPALVWAAATGERVVVATHTVALQDQLWQKDVPQAREAVGSVPVAVMKGRARYACLLKAEAAVLDREIGWTDAGDAEALAAFLVWLTETADGERDDWTGAQRGEGARLFDRIAADPEACAGSRCKYAGPCFLRRSRRQAAESLVVLTNHAQLLTHAARGDVLPPFQHLVIDEAHRLPQAADQVLGYTVALGHTAGRLWEWVGPRSLLHRLGLEPGAVGDVAGPLAALADALERLRAVMLATFSDEGSSVRLAGPVRERFVEAVGPALAEAQAAADAATQGFSGWIGRLRNTVPDADWNGPRWIAVRGWGTLVSEIAGALSVFGNGDPAFVDWWEWTRGPRPDVVVHRQALDPAPVLRERLWNALPGAAVLVSATLAVAGDFRFFIREVGLDRDVETALWPSPFPVDDRALLAAVTDVPEPGSSGHLETAADTIAALAQATFGRMLVLTTSWEATLKLETLLRGRLEQMGLELLVQGRDGPARRLARRLAERPASVLVGTASLWEGIDVPGPALTTVVVTRLPFRFVGDPLEAARGEALVASGRSPFFARTLPDAVLRFRQGFGRLLRTMRDFGAVVVLDSRMAPGRRRYAEAFWASVPGPRRIVGPSAEVVETVARFVRTRGQEGDG
jgi:ATP-dependent DNA helicase DinG